MQPGFYFVTFRPLVSTKAGREASERYSLPPFVDGSIRREPDFEHEMPAISCLCRGGNFAPRLLVGDHVAYATVKGRYDGHPAHRRLVAMLRVEGLFDSHEAAAAWYNAEGIALPNNLMVPGNKAKPLAHSVRGDQRTEPEAGCSGNRRTEKPSAKRPGCGKCVNPREARESRGGGCSVHADWDKAYLERSRRHPRVAVCTRLFYDLEYSATMLTDNDLQRVFGRVPGTRNPGRHPMQMFDRLFGRVNALAA
ncbi:MAG: hypothetical protein JJU33_11050 [Phycisphaerales bacterium]|nr:hypothetical protein [Phycisphaerales bacterium]